jgi:hypothetical protein
MKTSPDGCYNLISPVIYDDTPNAVFGEFEGFKYLPSFSNVAENTITEGANTYIVFPERSNTGDANFIAMLTA